MQQFLRAPPREQGAMKLSANPYAARQCQYDKDNLMFQHFGWYSAGESGWK